MKNNIIFGVLLGMLFFGTFLQAAEPAQPEAYTVIAFNDHPRMTTDFWISSIDYTVYGDQAVVEITTTGNCRNELVPECYTHWDDSHYDIYSGTHIDHHSHRDHHHPHQHCYLTTRWTCEHQKGSFPLPTDQIIYDGKKRWKYVGNGEYLTIARNNRKWWMLGFRKWDIRDNTKIDISNDYSTLTLTVQSQ